MRARQVAPRPDVTAEELLRVTRPGGTIAMANWTPGSFIWRQYYGPTQRAFEALAADSGKQAALRSALEQLWTTHNRARSGGTLVESESLDVRAVRSA